MECDMQEKINKVMDLCFEEMFSRVGEKYPNKELTDKPDWYTLHSWTDEQQNDFKKWMVSFLTKEMRWIKKTAEKEAGFFILNYGWSTKLF